MARRPQGGGQHAGRPARAQPRGERFRPADRVRRRWEYRRVQGEGERVHSRHYLLLVRAREEDPEGPPRLGLVVSRKVGSAVRRNRVKRVLREVFRRHRELFPRGCDVVVIAKRGAPALGYRQALEEIASVRGALRRRAERSRRRLAGRDAAGQEEA